MATKSHTHQRTGRLIGARERLEELLSNRKVMATLTVVPVSLLFILIVASPILWAIIASFYEIPAFSPQWEWVGLENYSRVIQDPMLWSSLSRNLVFAVGTALLNTVFGVTVALLLNREFKLKRFTLPIALVPYLIPTAFLSFIALWMSSQQWGVINQLLLLLGVINADGMIAWFTGNQSLAMFSLILTHSWKYSIFVAILVLSKLQSIPDDIYEAAQMSGASRYQQFRDITLPNIINILAIVVLLRGVWNFNKFDIIWILTRGGPGDGTTTIPVYAYEMAFQFNSLGRAAAISVLLFGLLSVVAAFYFHIAEPSKEVRVE
jgi:multiple sugar transport system permease protein